LILSSSSKPSTPVWLRLWSACHPVNIHTLDDLKKRREQEVAFLLAKLTLEKYFRQDGTQKQEKLENYSLDDSEVQAWLFPQVLQIAKQWIKKCVTYKSGTYPQLLLLNEFAHDASDCIYQAIVAGEQEKSLKPIVRPYDSIGSTRYVDFSTARPVYVTNPDKCHISHVVADTNSWEQKMAQVLEDMDEVVYYTKNQGLGFFIPYTLKGQQKNYMPDFIVKINDGQGDLLNLIVEVSGEARRDKAVKVATTNNLWIPAINQHGGFGRWNFIEITDPWDAENTIQALINSSCSKQSTVNNIQAA
ncbi:MAG: restriction endonuclease subunit R, partial [Cyanobacteria bacterium J06639_18]